MNFPATTWPTTFAGMGEKPGPTMKGWFSTGNEVGDEMLAWGNVAADETLSWDDVVAMLAMDRECEGFGGKKVDTKVGTTKAGMCSKASSRSSKSGGSALNNVFERLLSAQMGDFYQNILSEYISAYRRHHSCETSLLRLTEDWRRSLDNKEIVAVISMDLSKAFDTIPHALPLMQEHFL